MIALFHLFVFAAAVQGVYSLQCYVNGPINMTTIGIQDSAATPPDVCATTPCACGIYMYQCAGNNSVCTAQQLQNQTMIWIYVLTANTTCQSLVTSMTGMCCYTNLCNNPSMNMTTTSPAMSMTTGLPLMNSASILPFSIWIVLLALCATFKQI